MGIMEEIKINLKKQRQYCVNCKRRFICKKAMTEEELEHCPDRVEYTLEDLQQEVKKRSVGKSEAWKNSVKENIENGIIRLEGKDENYKI